MVFHWKDITHPYAGGAERLLHLLMKEMVPLGHSITWFCSKYEGGKCEETVDGIQIVRNGGQFSVYLRAVLFYLKNKGKIDVVVDNITGVPWFTPLYSSKPKIAIIYHVGKKETFFTELPAMKGLIGYPLAFAGWFAERVVPLFYSSVPFVTFSDDTKKDLVSLGIEPNHIFIAQEGINLSNYKAGKTKDSFSHVLYVGRLVKNKGIDYLIESMKIVIRDIPNAKLSIIGTGPFEARLKKLVSDLELKGVVSFRGYVSEGEKVELLQKAHVLVHPSLREGWATPVIEANACGTPAIGANVIGINSTIKEGTTGFLFTYGDIQELANKLVLLLSDSALRSEMGRNALKWAIYFDKNITVKRFIRILETVG
jgi:glycosyltransferase involved in cell wall biosynthesis